MKIFKKLYHYIIALVSYIYYGRPSRNLIVVGVTGTKGKSTTCRFVASVLEAGGYKVGVLSTVEFQVGSERKLNDKKMTMLGRGEIQKYLKKMIKAGCEYAVVETSSQGILQYRHKFLNYDIAVFTNLSSEHIEAHGGFENLKRDKGKLFKELKSYKIINNKKIKKVTIANGDDENVGYYLDFKADEKCIFGLGNLERYSEKEYTILLGENIGGRDGGNSFQIDDTKIIPNIVGDFNIYNALAGVVVGRSQGMSDEKIKQGIENVKLVEGRMEFIDEGQNFKVIVDYAHEPLSLSELFKSLRRMLSADVSTSVSTSGKIISIIGSDGGGRDISKREKMGEISGEKSDIVIITEVNPFDESSDDIANMIKKGVVKAGKVEGQDLFVINDRSEAVKKAFSMAREGDIVVLTAKGTEPYIIKANGIKEDWDDRVKAREILKDLK